jgi:predicted DNA-binding transcriptional regulator AlpA
VAGRPRFFFDGFRIYFTISFIGVEIMQAANDNQPNVLPISLPPRGLCRQQAAAYIGVSSTLFDTLVKDGRMPKPTRINARTIWDRLKIDLHFDALTDEQKNANPWQSVA